MEDDETAAWSLEKHLAVGLAALTLIEADQTHTDPEPVCHHFYEVDPVDPMVTILEATYGPHIPRFAAIGVDFLADRLEAWETISPNRQWLEARIPALLGAAEPAGLHYQGWTWEPHDRQPIGASAVNVINNRVG